MNVFQVRRQTWLATANIVMHSLPEAVESFQRQEGEKRYALVEDWLHLTLSDGWAFCIMCVYNTAFIERKPEMKRPIS
jgi:hypothetical protein